MTINQLQIEDAPPVKRESCLVVLTPSGTDWVCFVCASTWATKKATLGLSGRQKSSQKRILRGEKKKQSMSIHFGKASKEQVSLRPSSMIGEPEQQQKRPD
jgi:hypothetical protein